MRHDYYDLPEQLQDKSHRLADYLTYLIIGAVIGFILATAFGGGYKVIIGSAIGGLIVNSLIELWEWL